MGDDDANEGDGPGECPSHDWGIAEIGSVLHPGDVLPSLTAVSTCTRGCGAVSYEARISD